MKKLLLVIIPLLSLNILRAQVSSRNLYGFSQKNNIPVLENGDTLSFPWAGGINQAMINTIDLNMDGHEDLVVFDKLGKNFLPFVRKGVGSSGYYEYAPEFIDYFPAIDVSANWAFLRDYNCDGKKDLFYSTNGTFYVYTNTSTSTLQFTPANNGNRIESQYDTGKTLLYVPPMSTPALDDIDNDGAIDLLTFGNYSIEVERHKGQTPCGLDFLQDENCWGHFTESGLSRGVNLNSCTPHKKKTMDAGSTMTLVDLDGDQVKDILFGNNTFNSITAIYNGGTADSAHMTSQDTMFPPSRPAHVPHFPATYFEDVDFDDKPDLLVSPTEKVNNTVDRKSVSFYKNTGTASNPTFTFQQEDFLQDEMIDVGTRAVPRLVDLNNDSLMDLVVSNQIYHSTQNGEVHSYFYFENTGSPTQPVFTLVDTNFMDIGSYSNIANASIPTFGDLDGDGDMDAIVGDLNGDLHYFANSSATSPNFTLAQSKILSLNKNFAAPFLYDIDSNGTLDLLVGNENGSVYHYSNSSATSPAFTLQNANFGGINTKGGNTNGYSIPCVFRHNGVDNIFTGSYNSGIYQYDSIQKVVNQPLLMKPFFGTGNIVSSNTQETPLGIKHKNGRNQILITAAELRSAGLVHGYISALSFNITTTNNNYIEHLYIKIKSTNNTSLNGFETNLTPVLDERVQPLQGWHLFNFDKPFLWDGNSGIIIEVCFGGQTKSKDIHVEMTDVGFKANAYGDYVDQTNQGNGCIQPYSNSTTYRPNMRIYLVPAFANTENYGQGIYTAPAVADLDNDGYLDMIVGNINGGLSYYQGKIYDVSIEEPTYTDVRTLNVYPNPGNGNFTVSTRNVGQATISVYDLNGKLILKKNVDSSETTIDLQNQPTGIYLFVMQDKDELKTAKVIKQ